MLGKEAGEKMTFGDWVDGILLYCSPLWLGLGVSFILYVIAAIWLVQLYRIRKPGAPVVTPEAV
jgi:hypothetical protein